MKTRSGNCNISLAHLVTCSHLAAREAGKYGCYLGSKLPGQNLGDSVIRRKEGKNGCRGQSTGLPHLFLPPNLQ